MTIRTNSVSVLVETENNPSRRIESLAVLTETEVYPVIRRLNSLAIMLEYEDNPIRNIIGLSSGTSIVNALIAQLIHVYGMASGDIEVTGELWGNASIYGLNSDEALVIGDLIGILNIVGNINNQNLTSRYLFNLGKLRTTSFGIANISGVLDGYLNLTTNNFDNADNGGTMAGEGYILGISNGQSIVSAKLNGIFPISGATLGQSVVTGLVIKFIQNQIELEVKSSPFIFNIEGD